jgi:hypothetical protein
MGQPVDHSRAPTEGFSLRSLKYMRSFAAAWREELIVQQVAAQLAWGGTI